MPADLEKFDDEIKKVNDKARTDIETDFSKIIEIAKQSATILNNEILGSSFISMDANNDLEKLFRQVFTFAAIKKYTTKCKEWVGLGWDKNSKEILDVAVFLSYDWHEDNELDKMAKKSLKL